MSQITQPKFRAPNKIYQCTKNRPLFIFKRGKSMFKCSECGAKFEDKGNLINANVTDSWKKFN